MDQNKTPLYKRVLALIGIVLLAGMYIALLIFAIIGSPATKDIFFGCVAATVAIPIMIWILIWAIGSFTGRHTIASLDAMTSDKQHDKYGNVISKENDKINTVVFDIGNVLTDFAWEKFLKDKGFDQDKIDRIAKATVYSEDWCEYDKGNLTTEEIIQRFVENDPELKDDIEMAFKSIDGIILKRDRTIPWIKALQKAGYKVLYLSNFSKQALEGCKEAMAFIDETDGGILSYREHVIKPNPDIYHILEKRYNLSPEQTVFIDDTPVNIEAAVKLGWHGIVYRNYDQVKEELNSIGVIY